LSSPSAPSNGIPMRFTASCTPPIAPRLSPVPGNLGCYRRGLCG
jgi:hypothetical protein